MLLFRGGDKMESAHFRYINFMMVYFICPSSSLDIPELDESFWKNAVQNPFYKPTKQVTTVRIDADVMQWLKAQGKGYQTRMNKILRDAMLNELKNHP